MTLRYTNRRVLARLATRAIGPMVLACIISLGSLVGAHAAGLITGRQIKDGTVSGRDVRDGSVQGAQVALGTLHPGEYDGDATGPVGADGPAGPVGTVPGPPGFRGVSYVVGDPADVTTFATVEASCPDGTKVIGGGTARGLSTQTVGTATSAPTADGTSWLSGVYQWGGNTTQVFPWALCATVD